MTVDRERTIENNPDLTLDDYINALLGMGLAKPIIGTFKYGTKQAPVRGEHYLAAKIMGPYAKPEDMAGKVSDHGTEVIGAVLPLRNQQKFLLFFYGKATEDLPDGLIVEILVPANDIGSELLVKILSGKKGPIDENADFGLNFRDSRPDTFQLNKLFTNFERYGAKVGVRSDQIASGQELTQLYESVREAFVYAKEQKEEFDKRRREAMRGVGDIFYKVFINPTNPQEPGE